MSTFEYCRCTSGICLPTCLPAGYLLACLLVLLLPGVGA
jgi:hypothetical protein